MIVRIEVGNLCIVPIRAILIGSISSFPIIDGIEVY